MPKKFLPPSWSQEKILAPLLDPVKNFGPHLGPHLAPLLAGMHNWADIEETNHQFELFDTWSQYNPMKQAKFK